MEIALIARKQQRRDSLLRQVQVIAEIAAGSVKLSHARTVIKAYLSG